MDLKVFWGLPGVLEWRPQHKLSDLSDFPGFGVYANWGLRPNFGRGPKWVILM